MFRSRQAKQKLTALVLPLALLLPLAAAAADPPASSIVLIPGHWSDLGLDDTFDADCSARGCERRLPQRRLKFGDARGLGATLVEFKPHTMPGQSARAHHGIGIRSYQLESALNDIGIEARHCLAPVVRMHTKLSSGFDLSGTLWVYLRCTVK